MESAKITGSGAIEFIRENNEFSDLPIHGVSRLNRSDAQFRKGDDEGAGWLAKRIEGGQMIKRILTTQWGPIKPCN